MKYYFITTLLLLCLISCKPCVYHTICSTGPIFIYSKEYTAHDLDTVFIKKYTQGSGFTTIVDSTTLIGSGHKLTDSADGQITISDGYDYKIIAPIINKTFEVYNITNMGMYEHSEDYSCGAEPYTKYCTNNVTSFYINGKRVDSMYLQLTK